MRASSSNGLVCTLKTLIIIGLAPMIAGCPQVTSVTEPCAQVSVSGISNDASNNFTGFDGDQCDLVVGDGLLSLDILDHSTNSSAPRILFSLTIEGSDIPDGAVIALGRDDVDLETQLPPALYQEYQGPAGGGPFWSSNDGLLRFAVAADGTITGDFRFTADNPPTEDDNDAAGEVEVSGTILIRPTAENTGSGCGITFPLLGMTLVGLCSPMACRRFRA